MPVKCVTIPPDPSGSETVVLPDDFFFSYQPEFRPKPNHRVHFLWLTETGALISDETQPAKIEWNSVVQDGKEVFSVCMSWYKNGDIHRTDKPAIIRAWFTPTLTNTIEYWYDRGMLSKKDGPAMDQLAMSENGLTHRIKRWMVKDRTKNMSGGPTDLMVTTKEHSDEVSVLATWPLHTDQRSSEPSSVLSIWKRTENVSLLVRQERERRYLYANKIVLHSCKGKPAIEIITVDGSHKEWYHLGQKVEK